MANYITSLAVAKCYLTKGREVIISGSLSIYPGIVYYVTTQIDPPNTEYLHVTINASGDTYFYNFYISRATGEPSVNIMISEYIEQDIIQSFLKI